MDHNEDRIPVYAGFERRQTPAEIRIPAWLVVVLVSLLVTVLSVVFTMGMTYMKVEDGVRRLDNFEQRLERLEMEPRRIPPDH